MTADSGTLKRSRSEGQISTQSINTYVTNAPKGKGAECECGWAPPIFEAKIGNRDIEFPLRRGRVREYDRSCVAPGFRLVSFPLNSYLLINNNACFFHK